MAAITRIGKVSKGERLKIESEDIRESVHSGRTPLTILLVLDVSLSMKGMMGLIYNRRDFHLNMDLNTAVVDLCTVLKPQLTVIDVSRLLTSGGPGGPGKVLTMDKIVASTDMVAADATTVQLGTWYGRKFKARQVKHIRMAHKRGLGNMDISGQIVKEIKAS